MKIVLYFLCFLFAVITLIFGSYVLYALTDWVWFGGNAEVEKIWLSFVLAILSSVFSSLVILSLHDMRKRRRG